MSYCIYLRKSRSDDDDKTNGEVETLARHQETLVNLGKRLNLSITEIYREVVSGETISARPIVQQLLSEVEKGCYEGVLVMEVERLARGDTIDQGIIAQTFKYSDTKIITPTKIYDPQNEFDEEYFEFGLFMSRREYKTINRRLNRGRIASVAEGKFVGSKAPFGYERVKLQKEKGYSLKIVEQEAQIVRLIFEYFTTGKRTKDGLIEKLGLSNIAKELNKDGYKTATGMSWNYTAIGSILRNPTYIGKIKWGGRAQVKKVVDGDVIISRPRKCLEDIPLTEGRHKSIISDTQFYQAQSILSKNKRHTTPSKFVDKNPLASLIICADCGKKMSRRPNSKGLPDILLCQNPTCSNASCQLELVEKAIINSLLTYLERYKIETSVCNSSTMVQDTSKVKLLKANKSELKKLQKQQKSLYDLLEQGIYDKRIFIERNTLLSKNIDKLELSIEKLESEIINFKETEKDIVVPKINHILENYYSYDINKKHLLLESLIEKVIYKKQSGGRWKVKTDEFTIEIYPKI